jgi:hypothetical protein
MLSKSEYCTQVCITGLLKYTLIFIQYLYNYNIIKSVCESDSKTLVLSKKQKSSLLASDLTGFV